MSSYADVVLGGKAVTVTCKTCAHPFKIQFDFRRHQRLHVHLPGKLLSRPWMRPLSDVVVVSLSVSGVGLRMHTEAQVALGGVYELHFALEDETQARVYEAIVVRRIHGLFVGAAFYHHDRYNYELDFYLTSQLDFGHF
jgi:hypothetical protein